MTVLPWIPIPHGFIRCCDFPRLQIAGIAGVLLPLAFFTIDSLPAAIAAMTAEVAIIATQAFYCWPYTPLHRVQSKVNLHPASGRRLSVLSANVKMSNRRYDDLIALVYENEPDVLIAMEVDEAWADALRELRQKMPHSVEWPCANSYGMVILSRLPLVEPELRFLVFESVPSVRTAVQLDDGALIRLYAVHPEPPIPYEDSIGRDGELIKIAQEIQEDDLPAVVAGDLNDVAWSRSTVRFQRLTGLLDPRVGRGFYNTFDARFPLLRWPLDHVFHDARFHLVRLRRLRHIGSDHFPLLFELALEDAPSVGSPDDANKQDQEEANDLVRQAEELNREPVGAGWEG